VDPVPDTLLFFLVVLGIETGPILNEKLVAYFRKSSFAVGNTKENHT
jgi:hypothetical protein